MSFDFEKMEGFHRLKSFWKIDYKVVTMEPFLTRAVSDELKGEIGDKLGKTLPKPDLDAVPLVMGDRAIITGNAVKGIFRHLLSAQLTEANIQVCVQSIKVREEIKSSVEKELKEKGLKGDELKKQLEEKLKEKLKKTMGRLEECKADNPCFICTWFGTPSRQGALHFGILQSTGILDEILIDEPIPMVALSEDMNALIAVRGKGRFALLAPVKEGTEFSGWIKGENLSEEIIGAIKEVQDMSEEGFVQLGGYKTRGFGSVKIEILRIKKYKTVPFELEKKYEGNELKDFLEKCQKKYHELLSRGKKS